MVSRDRFSAMPLIPPGPASSDARATGYVLANALRSGYIYAQTEGAICGVQNYQELPYLETDRRIESGVLSAVAVVKRHVPPYARKVTAGIAYQVFTRGSPECVVHHRMTMSYTGGPDVGPEQVDTVTGINSIYLDPDDATIFFYVDPVVGIWGPYDLPVHHTTCYAEFENITINDANAIVITVEAYATRLERLDVTATESDRTSNLVTAVVPRGHRFSTQMQIWTENFDENVPQESPAQIDSIAADSISWELIGGDDANFGEGTIHSVFGTPAVYRPASISIWWET